MNMLRFLFLLLCFVAIGPSTSFALDTIFAKGGTCLYKIRTQYKQCMDDQEARLKRDKDDLPPIYTREALTDSVNKISCCAYWDFVTCVEKAADEFCPNERRDMRAYVRQLGSAVPYEDCYLQYPRDSPHCVKSLSLFDFGGGALAPTSGIILVFVLIIFAAFLNHHNLAVF